MARRCWCRPTSPRAATDDAVRWLEEAVDMNPQLYPTLADMYARGRRYADAAAAYESALKISLRSVDLRVRYAGMLLGTGVEKDAVRARDVLREAVELRAPDDRTLERALLLLAQAERRTGELDASERTARRVISQNRRSARAYVALAETLEERRRYQDVADALAPAVALFRGDADSDGPLSMLLPHLGFAYQQLGQYDKAIAALQEAHKVTGGDPAVSFYLIQAQLSAKRYSDAVATGTTGARRATRRPSPGAARSRRTAARGQGRRGGLGARAGRQAAGGQPDGARRARADLSGHQPRRAGGEGPAGRAHEVSRRGLASASSSAPISRSRRSTPKPKRRSGRCIAQQPEHGPALNYLGYMLAERGERLTESVDLIKRALETEPDNGSYLDSLGWAYFKDGKFDLAVEHSETRGRPAADQLGRPGSLRRRAVPPRPVRRGDRRVVAGAGRRSAKTSTKPASTGRSVPPSRSCHANDRALARSAADRRRAGRRRRLFVRGAADDRFPPVPARPPLMRAEAFAEATAACRAVTSLTADASVSGSAGRQRLRARLNLGVQSPASARLEAIGPFARPVFILAARGDAATLLLNDDNRILRGGPSRRGARGAYRRAARCRRPSRRVDGLLLVRRRRQRGA